jgi:hypothetical protein
MPRVKHFYTHQERCKVLNGYLSLGHQLGGEWANTYIGRKCLQSSFQTEVAAAPVTATSSSLSYSSTRPLLQIYHNNYTIQLLYNKITKHNNNNAISNKINYGRLHAISLLLKVSMSTRKNFFEITDNLYNSPPKGSPAQFYCCPRQRQTKARFKTLLKHLVVNRKRRRGTGKVSVTLVSMTAIRSGGTSEHTKQEFQPIHDVSQAGLSITLIL